MADGADGADGADSGLVEALRTALHKAGAKLVVIRPARDGASAAEDDPMQTDAALDGAPSCLFDAVVVLGHATGIKRLKSHPADLQWLRDALRRLKVIGLDAAGRELAQAARSGEDDAVLTVDHKRSVDNFCRWAARGKYIARERPPGTEL